MRTNASICLDEEEAAFLRFLEWEESAGNDGGLTEEEINAFYQEYMKLKPSLKLQQGIQPKLLMIHGLHGHLWATCHLPFLHLSFFFFLNNFSNSLSSNNFPDSSFFNNPNSTMFHP